VSLSLREILRKRSTLTAAIVLVLAIVILALAHRDTRPKYVTERVIRGNIVASVEATGTINPLTTAPVGSFVSGTVKYIFADFNSRVQAGQVLAQLDPAVYEARLVQTRGNLQRAVANLRSAQANVTKAAADLSYANANAKRTASLNQQGLTPLDQRQLSESTAAQASEQRNQAVAQVEQARADIVAMTGALHEAETNLRSTTILSPTDGVVVARNITVGQSVAASLQAPNLFTIAQDLKRMQVYAKTDESDTGFIRVGADATFQVDAFPTEVFHGRVSVIRLNAYIVQNVVTYDTIIDFENLDERLLPGETAYVTISTGSADNALLVPNSALSFTPDLGASELDRLYSKNAIPKAAYTTHRNNEQVVWKLVGGRDLEPVAIRAGISDSLQTQILSGNVKLDDVVATGSMTSSGGSQSGKAPIPNRPTGGRR
jgi:HlyD family secretion protein